MNFEGIVIGAGAFMIIGILHPVVIKTEYHIGARAWPMFLITGLLCIGLSLFWDSSVPSSLLSILGFSLLWSIQELFQQEKRVAKGWFPKNPKKDHSLR
ncbi:MAG TPA: DUF4491 family protein [Anaerolineaceae bacterium]|jgi:uncharacterized membrane protein|nr:DUF4491 family protein [Anaerolineaceae bacterium]